MVDTQALPPTGGGWHGFAVTDGGDVRRSSCHFEPTGHDFQRTAHPREILLRPSQGRTTHKVEISPRGALPLGRNDIGNSPQTKSAPLGFPFGEAVEQRETDEVCSKNAAASSAPLGHLPQGGRQAPHPSQNTPFFAFIVIQAHFHAFGAGARVSPKPKIAIKSRGFTLGEGLTPFQKVQKPILF